MPGRDTVDFDHIIVGAGLSGLLLADSLLDTQGVRRLLVVDPRPADDRSVTYAYWSTRPTILDRWAVGSWNRLKVVDRRGQETSATLNAARYVAVSWNRARAELFGKVSQDSRVTLLQQAVDLVWDGTDCGCVRVGDTVFTGRWVYDSRPPRLPVGAARGRATHMVQAFRGIWVRAAGQVIDTRCATLLDFSTDDGPDLAFTYVLPVASQLAMVMAVRMSASPQMPDPVPAATRLLGSADWTEVAEESGTTLLIPSRRRRQGRHILAIGLRGGRVRASTGYAVTRILADTERIRHSLRTCGHPFAVEPDPWWQVILDRIWLQALTREAAELEEAFLSLFTRAPVDSVVRFLDGGAGRSDVAAVIRALPPLPFLRALLA